MPTVAHVIYIPAMLMLGIVIGYSLGSRAARAAFEADKARKEARAARLAARAQQQSQPDSGTDLRPDSGSRPIVIDKDMPEPPASA